MTMNFVLLSGLIGLITISLAQGQAAYEETRESYVDFPNDAVGLLAEEVAEIGSPLGFEVVTSLAPSPPNRGSSDIWNLLKGIVRRLHKQNQIVRVIRVRYWRFPA